MRSHPYFADKISREEFRHRGIRPLKSYMKFETYFRAFETYFEEKRTWGGGGGVIFCLNISGGILKKCFLIWGDQKRI